MVAARQSETRFYFDKFEIDLTNLKKTVNWKRLLWQFVTVLIRQFFFFVLQNEIILHLILWFYDETASCSHQFGGGKLQCKHRFLSYTLFNFRACEYAYNLLERTFLPLFYQSDDVSFFLLCRLHQSLNRYLKQLFVKIWLTAFLWIKCGKTRASRRNCRIIPIRKGCGSNISVNHQAK